jgi:hypothetical protein
MHKELELKGNQLNVPINSLISDKWANVLIDIWHIFS